MIKQIIIPLVLVATFIAAVGWFVKSSPNINLPGSTSITKPVSEKVIKIGSTEVSVEVANTADSRAKGLGGRASLAKDSGMIFTFDSQNVTPTFWMKGMEIGLDIIWINDGKVVGMAKNIPAPPPGATDSRLTLYNPGQPIDYVLEVNSGFCDSNNIKIGDLVTLPTL